MAKIRIYVDEKPEKDGRHLAILYWTDEKGKSHYVEGRSGLNQFVVGPRQAIAAAWRKYYREIG